jgi:membrane-associated phospholipid phosphatase
MNAAAAEAAVAKGDLTMIIGAVVAVLVSLILPVGAAAAAQPAAAGTGRPAAPNPVTEWAAIVQPAIHSPAEPRGAASSYVLHTITQLAVYDAVVAITGGYQPYNTAVPARPGADLRAAVATAAYRAARGRVAPSQVDYLDERYGTYMAAIPDPRAKQHGIEAGEASAAAILARRAGDGFDKTVTYACSAVPPLVGEFEPDGGCGTQPAEAKLASVTPFTFGDPAEFRPDGPDPMTSERWVADFNEVKAYGGKNSTVRTPEQTDLAYFWAEHPYAHWNRNLINLATARGLDTRDTARLLALAWTTASDAVIAGWEAKYFYRSWRPRKAIPRAEEDGHPGTAPDAAWTPLLSVNHPEYPSAHAFVAAAMMGGLTEALGTPEVEWTIETSQTAVPQLVRSQRTYRNLNAILADLNDARVWAGLHFRSSMTDGFALGNRVAAHVTQHYFRPSEPGPARLRELPRTGSSGPTPWPAGLGATLIGVGAATRAVARRRFTTVHCPAILPAENR